MSRTVGKNKKKWLRTQRCKRRVEVHIYRGDVARPGLILISLSQSQMKRDIKIDPRASGFVCHQCSTSTRVRYDRAEEGNHSRVRRRLFGFVARHREGPSRSEHKSPLGFVLGRLFEHRVSVDERHRMTTVAPCKVRTSSASRSGSSHKFHVPSSSWTTHGQNPQPSPGTSGNVTLTRSSFLCLRTYRHVLIARHVSIDVVFSNVVSNTSVTSNRKQLMRQRVPV